MLPLQGNSTARSRDHCTHPQYPSTVAIPQLIVLPDTNSVPGTLGISMISSHKKKAEKAVKGKKKCSFTPLVKKPASTSLQLLSRTRPAAPSARGSSIPTAIHYQASLGSLY